MAGIGKVRYMVVADVVARDGADIRGNMLKVWLYVVYTLT